MEDFETWDEPTPASQADPPQKNPPVDGGTEGHDRTVPAPIPDGGGSAPTENKDEGLVSLLATPPE